MFRPWKNSGYFVMFILGTGVPAYATPGPTRTALSVSASTVTWPAPVTLTATVKAGATAVKPGLVRFCVATSVNCQAPSLLGQAQLTAGGTASIKLILGVGAHSIKAIFSGTNAYASSTSSAQTVTVAGGSYPTTTTITASGTQGNYTLTATVLAAGGQAPTSQVDFADVTNSGPIGLAPLVPGTTSTAFVPVVTSSSVGNEPIALGVGDFNGDGKPDVAVGNVNANTVTILLGHGDGTFAFASESPTGSTHRDRSWRLQQRRQPGPCGCEPKLLYRHDPAGKRSWRVHIDGRFAADRNGAEQYRGRRLQRGRQCGSGSYESVFDQRHDPARRRHG